MKKASNYLINISLITLITALGWIVFDAYHSYVTNTVSAPLQKIALPLAPQIDTQIIDKLKTRQEPYVVK